MKLFKTLIAAALVAAASPALADLSDILSAGKVKIAVPESFPPFGALGAEGEHEGYDVDVAKLIAENLGVELELVPVVSKQRIPFLETDRVDLVVSVMGANPERAKSIWFSAAYAPFYSGAFASADKAIAGPADLAGFKVGLTGGTLEDLELTKLTEGTDVEIIRFGDNAATLSAFISGQVDVLVSGNTAAAEISEKNPDMSLERKFIIKDSPAFIGVKKGNYDLLQWVNVFILHKKLGGELNAISEKWLGQALPPLPTF
ncbi:MAG: amino acid ABC transporter substrate-binding protein [Confluentimicrobium sp.]|jgi:polar amino acid transport system substrate-binding protein|uniref:Polar amino acid transport system substrate-binding protein n=1 Tax=Actibacterium naphthalenivorans TaxID=1614693 RepID=A0A840CAC0_9RHOB|nr:MULTISPECIES: transporter substrate-binding domain-containing protein [Actibacterium]ALG91568.1 amino acid ABC transporter substrate-binding protein [Actibacterium sp. EMB200-NS6]MBB4021813.1 polar amino acid transport system substrate-binding protein [Actibacterium naphthalenivorans]MBC55398.1 amino acid ABC transporter substrate-binding protein [Actibacterium sp.]MDY6860153.1 transporter substrate-binding domain-containing protein [Pseudomonadota bacterium]|tara:strand:+ start:3728 stop:4507 length:780 start_codon:yes stop_codon:yes gene_type:complete